MPMTAILLTAFFAVTGIAAITVLASSYMRTFRQMGSLYRAASGCQDSRSFKLTFKDLEGAPARPKVRLRIVSPRAAALRVGRTPELPAAA